MYWKPFKKGKIPYVIIDVVGIPTFDYYKFLTG